MKNPFRITKEKTVGFARNHPIISLYLGATLTANALVYSIQAGVEKVERLFGAQTSQYEGRLLVGSSRDIMLPSVHGQIRSGAFILNDGNRLDVLDGPVITEGHFRPSMRKLEEGKRYRFKTFGNDALGYRFVEGEEITSRGNQ